MEEVKKAASSVLSTPPEVTSLLCRWLTVFLIKVDFFLSCSASCSVSLAQLFGGLSLGLLLWRAPGVLPVLPLASLSSRWGTELWGAPGVLTVLLLASISSRWETGFSWWLLAVSFSPALSLSSLLSHSLLCSSL